MTDWLTFRVHCFRRTFFPGAHANLVVAVAVVNTSAELCTLPVLHMLILIATQTVFRKDSAMIGFRFGMESFCVRRQALKQSTRVGIWY